jgi:hypothetical protein
VSRWELLCADRMIAGFATDDFSIFQGKSQDLSKAFKFL